MSPSLRGRRILVTGASSGIGLATARRLAQDGAQLALLARSEPALRAAARDAAARGAHAVVVPADVTDRAALHDAVATAERELGGLDALVSCAAGLAYGAFTDLRPEDFDRSHDVTFGGAVNAVRATLPALERSGGSIVAVVSAASKVPMPLHSPYVAGKFALRGFLGALRAELRNRGSRVTVSMVHPGFVGTPFFDHATSADGTRPNPLRPRYRPEDVADAIAACLRHPRAEVHVGGSVTLAAALAAVARPLVDLALATYGVEGQRRADPAPDPGMLWEPSGEGRAAGTVEGRHSLWTPVRLAAGMPLDVLDALPGVRRVVRLVR